MAHKSKSYNYKFQDSLNKFEQSGKFPESFWTAESSWTGWTVFRQYLHFSTHVAKAIYPPLEHICRENSVRKVFAHGRFLCLWVFSSIAAGHNTNSATPSQSRLQVQSEGTKRVSGRHIIFETSRDTRSQNQLRFNPKNPFFATTIEECWTKLIGCDSHSLVKMGGMF